MYQRRLVPSLKYIIVGDYAVGKTSLCRMFSQYKFKEDYKPTIGVNILTKTVKIFQKLEIRLQIWDLAGQQRFFEVMEDYYKGAKGGSVVFDITRPQSFENVDEWVKMVRKYAGNIPLLLVGNKIDLDNLRSISSEEALEKAKSLELLGYIEASAKLNKNVEAVFIKPIEAYLRAKLASRK